MEIVYNIEDLIKKLDDGKPWFYLAFSFKVSFDEFHQGHKDLIRYGKDHRKVAVVLNTPMGNIGSVYKNVCDEFNILKSKPIGVNRNDAWFRGKKIDLLFIVNNDYYKNDYYKGKDVEGAKQLVEEWFTKENYYEYLPRLPKKNREVLYNEALPKWWAVNQIIYPRPENVAYLSSWKEGIHRFIQKDIAEKYLKREFVLIDPTSDSSGITYSSRRMVYSEIEKQVLTDLINHCQSGKEPSSFTTDKVKLEIMYYYQIDGGIVGEGKKYLSISFKINGKPDTHSTLYRS